MNDISINFLTNKKQWIEAFPILNQLRSHLTQESYLNYLQEMRKEGYIMVALFKNKEIVCVAGIAIRNNFYYGKHVFIYDLVTDSKMRSQGFGLKVLEYLERYGREHKCEMISLESGLTRYNAHRFYEEKINLKKFCYSFKKAL